MVGSKIKNIDKNELVVNGLGKCGQVYVHKGETLAFKIYDPTDYSANVRPPIMVDFFPDANEFSGNDCIALYDWNSKPDINSCQQTWWKSVVQRSVKLTFVASEALLRNILENKEDDIYSVSLTGRIP